MSNLKVENISFSYDGYNKILKDISFSLNNDDILVILGASGDGKTTLLKIISGLLVEQTGNVYINDILQKQILAHNRKVSYIFQENVLYPHMTIYENLMMGFKKQKLSQEEKDLKIKDVISNFKITKFINLKPKHLSLGEKQKISLAKTFLSNADVYLFDEPFSALDIQSREKYLLLIKMMHEKMNCPFIYVSHEQEDAYKLANKIMILKEGKILQLGSLLEVNDNPLYLEVREYFGEKLNVFDVEVNENNLVMQLNYKNISLPLGKIKYRGKALIGIEQNLFSIIDDETDDSFKGIYINSFIDKNGSQFALVEVNHKEIVVKQQNNQFFDKGDEINIKFEKEYFLFDRFTHKNLLYKNN